LATSLKRRLNLSFHTKELGFNNNNNNNNNNNDDDDDNNKVLWVHLKTQCAYITIKNKLVKSVCQSVHGPS